MGNEQSNEGKKSARSPTSESDADADSCSMSASTSKTATAAASANVRQKVSDDTVGAALGLSSYQMQMLTQSWPRVQQTGGHQVGGHLFRKLASKSPPCREAFQKLTILEGFSPRGTRSVDVYKEHGRLLFELFNDAIKSLNEPAVSVVTTCREYGSKHAGMYGPNDGFGSSSSSSRMWDDLSEILVEHITKMDAVRKHRELCKAWTVLITFLMEKCKDGCRTSTYRKASSHPSSSTSSTLTTTAANSGSQQQSHNNENTIDVTTSVDSARGDHNDVDDDEDKTVSLSS